MSIISNIQIPSKIISADEEIVVIFLIIILLISFLLSDTEYWDEYVSNTLNIFSYPIFLIFMAMVLFKFVMIKT